MTRCTRRSEGVGEIEDKSCRLSPLELRISPPSYSSDSDVRGSLNPVSPTPSCRLEPASLWGWRYRPRPSGIAGPCDTVVRLSPSRSIERPYFFFLAVLRLDFFAVFLAAFLALLAMLPS